eukprot:TRINITY_DN3911_c0_g1_i1.p1 TRINITY_DN3911_c0_g1~~TRINITY_DN3911_c0_g1_i1.p1  ORF type:complete len:511 (+),score=60.62 TRINITY_DN3911_c0_g1_i1:71-1603(+)
MCDYVRDILDQLATGCVSTGEDDWVPLYSAADAGAYPVDSHGLERGREVPLLSQLYGLYSTILRSDDKASHHDTTTDTSCHFYRRTRRGCRGGSRRSKVSSPASPTLKRDLDTLVSPSSQGAAVAPAGAPGADDINRDADDPLSTPDGVFEHSLQHVPPHDSACLPPLQPSQLPLAKASDLVRSGLLGPIPDDSVPTNERLKSCLDAWIKIGASKWTLSVIEHGYFLQWNSRAPTIHRHRQPKHTWITMDKNITASLETQVKDWVELKVVHHVAKSKKGFQALLFGVPRKDRNEARPILDLRKLNCYTKKTKFKMDSLKTVIQLSRKGDWATKIDISRAYWHVKIAEPHSRFLRFWWNGELYEFSSMPFGLRDAPRVFTLILREVAKYIRSFGVRCVFYLDDILVVGSSAAECRKNTSFTLGVLKSLGFLIRESKCQLEPTQKIEYLGLILDLKSLSFRVPAKRRRAIRHSVKRMINQASRVTGTALWKLRLFSSSELLCFNFQTKYHSW